ncbi:hypothetical protein ADUPG1_002251, partial [Aduncisulcus paluster]
TISDFMDGEEPKATLQELSTARLDSLIADFAKDNKVTSNLNLEFSLKEPTFDLSSEEEEEEKEEGEKEAIKEIKSVNDLSKLELEIGITFSIDLKCSDTSGSVEAVQLLELLNQARVDENLLFISYSQVSGSGKTHTFVKAHKKVYEKHETRVAMIA